jgi:hypothetical protein
MAKRQVYNLADEEFAFFVNKLHEQLQREKIPYVLVGGVAVQAHVLKRLHEKTGKSLIDLANDPNMRLQDFVRSTDDIDLSVHSYIENNNGEERYANKINNVLEGLVVPEVVSPSDDLILGYRLVRRGISRPVYQVYVFDETDDEQRIALNIGRNKKDLQDLEADNYDFFVESGETMTLPYAGDFDISMRIIKPEHLLAAKTAKFRPKDTMDMHNLVNVMIANGEVLDLGEMRRLLLPTYAQNFHRFLDLTKLEASVSNYH